MEGASADSRKGVRAGRFLVYVAGVASFIALTWWLRRLAFTPDPLLYGLLQIVSGVLAFTFVASALVRFRGTRDRSALVLAFGFALTGAFTTGASVGFFRQAALEAHEIVGAPLLWWISQTLLAVVMVLALAAGRGIPAVRHPGREIGVAVLLVTLSSYLTTVVYEKLPMWRVVFPQAMVPRPLHLLTAAIFLLAAIGF